VLIVRHALLELQRKLPHVRSGAAQNVAPSLGGSRDTTHSPLMLVAAVAAVQVGVPVGGRSIVHFQNGLEPLASLRG